MRDLTNCTIHRDTPMYFPITYRLQTIMLAVGVMSLLCFSSVYAAPFEPIDIYSKKPKDAPAQQFGPYDYYDPPKGAVALVEKAHMGANIERQFYYKDWCGYWSNLDYTLRAFPNHPRALVLMAEYRESHLDCLHKSPSKTAMDLVEDIDKGKWEERSADYYFTRGVEFRLNRPATRILYGKYLYEHKRYDDALAQFTQAEKLQPSAVDTHYYLGLIYLEKKNNEQAMLHAEKAYKLGQPAPDLRNRLIAAGVWKAK